MVLGEDELAGGYATLKDMTAGSQKRVPLSAPGLEDELNAALDALQRRGVRDNSASTGH